MMDILRLGIMFGLLAVLIVLISQFLHWRTETSRVLARALRRDLNGEPDAQIIDVQGQRAAGLSIEQQTLAVLWEKGRSGLIFPFEEIEGAELIVDSKVIGRVQKGETRRVLDETHASARDVILRFIFDDPRWPEFEIHLYDETLQAQRPDLSADRAVRIGRRWLSQIDALLRRALKLDQKRKDEARAKAEQALMAQRAEQAAREQKEAETKHQAKLAKAQKDKDDQDQSLDLPLPLKDPALVAGDSGHLAPHDVDPIESPHSPSPHEGDPGDQDLPKRFRPQAP